MPQPHTTSFQPLTGDTTCKSTLSLSGSRLLGHSCQDRRWCFHGSLLSHLRTAEFAEPTTIQLLSGPWQTAPSELSLRQALAQDSQARVNLPVSGDSLPTRAKVPTHQIRAPRGPLYLTSHEGLTSGAANHFPQLLLQRGQDGQKPLSRSHCLSKHTFAPSLGTELRSHICL